MSVPSCNACNLYHPTGLSAPPSQHESRTMQLLLVHTGTKRPKAVRELQVSSLVVPSVIAPDLTACIVVPGPPSTASVSPHGPLTNPDTDPLHAVQGVPKVTLETDSQGRLCGPRGKIQQEPQGMPRGIGANKKGQSLDQCMVSSDIQVYAHCSGSCKSRVGSPRDACVCP